MLTIYIKSVFIFITLLVIRGLQKYIESKSVIKKGEKGKIFEKCKTVEIFQFFQYIIIFFISIEFAIVRLGYVNLIFTEHISQLIMQAYNYLDSLQPLVYVTSTLIYLIGFTLRILAIKTLGDYWSFHVEIKHNHKIVNHGIYHYCRHPAYIGNIYLVAMALFFEAIIASILALIGIVIFGIYRVRIEDKYILKPLRMKNLSDKSGS